MRKDKTALLKMALGSPIFLGGLGLLFTGALLGALTQRSRQRRRLQKTLTGRLLLAVRND